METNRLLITGASGLVGRAVEAHLRQHRWDAIRLRRGSAGHDAAGAGPVWDRGSGEIAWGGTEAIEAVVHLAGEPVAQRWGASAKRRIYESRVNGTQQLGRALARLARPPRIVICASAIGYYGDRGESWLDESAAVGTGFLAEVCRDWEAAAFESMPRGSRVVCLRLGLVLTAQGGALAKMLPIFRLGLGGRLGDGRQQWSWIALPDLVRVVEEALRNERLEGAVNAVSPAPVSNAEFTRALAKALRRPAWFPVPRFAVGTAFGAMGREMLLASARVRPTRLLQAGFHFQFPELEGALRAALAPEASRARARGPG